MNIHLYDDELKKKIKDRNGTIKIKKERENKCFKTDRGKTIELKVPVSRPNGVVIHQEDTTFPLVSPNPPPVKWRKNGDPKTKTNKKSFKIFFSFKRKGGKSFWFFFHFLCTPWEIILCFSFLLCIDRRSCFSDCIPSNTQNDRFYSSFFLLLLLLSIWQDVNISRFLRHDCIHWLLIV